MTNSDERYFDPAIETLDRVALRRLQEERLLAAVAYAYERSPLVRHTWQLAGVDPAEIRTVDDFTARAPFTGKATILEMRDRLGDPFGGMSALPVSELDFAGVSSGTSGSTVFFPERLTQSVLEDRPIPGPGAPLSTSQQAFWDRNLWEMGLRPGDYMVYSSYTYRGPNFHPCLAIGGIPILTDHYPNDFSRMVRLCRELRPTVMYLLSGPMMIELAKLGAEADLADAFSSLKSVAWGGEPLGRNNRKLIDDWGIRPLQVANVGDAAGAIECQERSGAHVWEDAVLAEVLDEAGREVADGEIGELVVTSLANPVSPQIRWRSDDLVRIDRRPCGCGRTHARISIVGRRGDQTIIDGKAVVPMDVMPVVELIPECRDGLFQIVRSGPTADRLTVRVGARTTARTTSTVHSAVTDALNAALGVTCDVEIVDQDVLLRQGPPHKIPRVVGA